MAVQRFQVEQMGESASSWKRSLLTKSMYRLMCGQRLESYLVKQLTERQRIASCCKESHHLSSTAVCERGEPTLKRRVETSFPTGSARLEPHPNASAEFGHGFHISTRAYGKHDHIRRAQIPLLSAAVCSSPCTDLYDTDLVWIPLMVTRRMIPFLEEALCRTGKRRPLIHQHYSARGTVLNDECSVRLISLRKDVRADLGTWTAKPMLTSEHAASTIIQHESWTMLPHSCSRTICSKLIYERH